MTGSETKMANRRPGPARRAQPDAGKNRPPIGPAAVLHRVALVGAGQRLDSYLGQYLAEHSRSEWQRLVESGSVTLNGQPTKPAARVVDGDRLEIRPIAPHALLVPYPTIELDILYEDPAIVVLNKQTGLVVHPAPGHESRTLVHALLARFPALRDPTGQMRPGIIHRLEMDTSGVMVVGKTPEAVAFVQYEMPHGRVHKRSRLLVAGTIREAEGSIEAPIGRDRMNRQRMAVRADGRAARTEFRVLQRFPGFTYIDAGLPSGRTHQLRVHFAYIGHPVAGDRTYGRGRAPGALRRQFVHAYSLTLASPS